MNNRPRSVSFALIFILLNALVWLVLGIIIAANVHPALPVQPILKGFMAFLSFAIAAVLLGLFIFLKKRNRIAYWFAIGLLGLITLATFFDQLGLVDLGVLVLNIAPIILLIKDRTWYLKTKPGG
jgi:lysylphosphatidylglycerol synthetase-like protein (DUF2156 family)